MHRARSTFVHGFTKQPRLAARRTVAHLCAAWPHRTLVGDFQMFATDEIAEDLTKEPAKVKDGFLTVPAGPGLGIELDEGKLEKLRVAGSIGAAATSGSPNVSR